MDCIALRHTHTTSLRCHPHVPTFESCHCSSFEALGAQQTWLGNWQAAQANDVRSCQNGVRAISDVTDVLGKMMCALVCALLCAPVAGVAIGGVPDRAS